MDENMLNIEKTTIEYKLRLITYISTHIRTICSCIYKTIACISRANTRENVD